MVLKGRGLGVCLDLDDFGILGIPNIILGRNYEVSRDGELFVEFQLQRQQTHNFSAYDRLILVTRNSRLARVGRFRLTGNGTADEIKIIPFNPINPGWDPIFIGALEKRGEEIYMMILPAPAGDDLEAKLLIGLTVPIKDLLVQDPRPQDAQPLVELPDLVADGAGKVDLGALLVWAEKANELAGTQPGLSFGLVAGSLPAGLPVSNVGYIPGFTIYDQLVFPQINDVRVVSTGEGFMIDVAAEATIVARGLFYRRNPDPAAEEAVERVEVKELQFREFIRDIGQTLNRRMALSVVDHDLGTLVVDNMEVESIKRVCKKGKKLYRIGFRTAESLNSRVHTGNYGKCSLWLSSVWIAEN
jgi:hypothetical protein